MHYIPNPHCSRTNLDNRDNQNISNKVEISWGIFEKFEVCMS